MKKKLLILSSALLFSAGAFAQKNNWQSTVLKTENRLRDHSVRTSAQTLFALDLSQITAQLHAAPESSLFGKEKGVLLSFPTNDGSFAAYEVFEASTMHPDLQSRYSDIKSYVGYRKGDVSSEIRFTVDPYFGFNGMMRDAENIYYLDSYTQDNKVYRLYNRKNATSNSQFDCLFNTETAEALVANSNSQKTVIDGLKRLYRLAITTTTEYTAYIATQAGVGNGTDAQKKAAVLAAVNLAVNRLNQVFEKDLSVRFQLIANTDVLFFIQTDTFNALDAGQMLGENITVTNNLIGVANYDLGHLFFQANAGNDNGLAQTPSVCSNNKAGGVTGSAVPVGDPFVIDYVAHEMGHQFGANHTQNNNCNRNNATSVEPGSASSIMGYAGICPPNVQSNSDAYFHAVSIAEIYTRLTTGNTSTCGTKTPFSNAEPVVNAGLDKTIPKSTPFVLNAVATDSDNDPLTYTWEQTDFGAATMPPLPANTVGPLFRSVLPTANSFRYFPRLSTIISGYNPAINTPTDVRAWEKLASGDRILNFSAMVRDNNTQGGQTGRDDVKITVTNSAGPFVVTSQNTAGIIWNQGSAQTITWDVANTTSAPVSTPNVTILLSKDGGLTFPEVIVSSTPNNGTYTYTVPAGLGTFSNARIMVKAVDNVFLNVNSQNISVVSSAVVVPPPGGNPGTPGTPTPSPIKIFEGLMIYPVPSYDGYVYIKADFPPIIPRAPYEVTYEIYSMDGKLIIPKKTRYIFEQHLERINLTYLPKETYLIHVTVNGEKIVKKLLMFNN
ncbi:hypothetical protein ASG01_09270 [Chryseobacterium sp. Leaf180]|uniref:reprolysin-like metallopeptidase n=1 Tax=Chryseobacterium sp. Leaf180 TaxID=1736289 RepID=UPI000700E3E4|nr:zinc-dependent metalloprotease family protein [Chryseobacterium sp. Leaf180]KQR93370.1 hypothetical protein ASG01_09270 [Chryseobacterium sp. Leaf180]